MSIVKRFCDAYVEQLRVKNPIKMKMFTTFMIYCLGDITCQAFIERGQNKSSDNIETKKEGMIWDFKRTLRQGVVAGGISNPVN